MTTSTTTLVSLLNSWGFDVRTNPKQRFIAVRHVRTAMKFYEESLESLELYQRYQSKAYFTNCDYIVSFIASEGRQATFVGLYRKGQCLRNTDEGFPEPTGRSAYLTELRQYPVHYDFERDLRFDGFRDTLEIDWAEPEHMWNRNLLRFDKAVLGISVREPQTQEQDPPLVTAQNEFVEGTLSYRTHLHRERNPALAQAAKALAKATKGQLACEVCNFNFADKYGDLGADFIECHHVLPMCHSDSERLTKLEDVVLLCSNCHSMVHRRKPWPTKAELGKILAQDSGGTGEFDAS